MDLRTVCSQIFSIRITSKAPYLEQQQTVGMSILRYRTVATSTPELLESFIEVLVLTLLFHRT